MITVAYSTWLFFVGARHTLLDCSSVCDGE
jgi:hypothetical protein